MILSYQENKVKQFISHIFYLHIYIHMLHCFFTQIGTLQTQDLLQFLSDIDFPCFGKQPSTWKDCVLPLMIHLEDEMENYVIRSAATLLQG